MKVRVLALDYDGTIASAGALDPEVRAALKEARSRGIVVIIVTGRMLDDLRAVAGGLQLADAVVAENGAVVAFSACESRSFRLAPYSTVRVSWCCRSRSVKELAAHGAEATWRVRDIGASSSESLRSVKLSFFHTATIPPTRPRSFGSRND